MTFKSEFRLSVPDEFYQSVCLVCEKPFADSYLYGARIIGGKLWPRTQIGWERLRGSKGFMDLMKDLGIELAKPTPFPGDGDRPTAEDEGFINPKKKQRSFHD